MARYLRMPLLAFVIALVWGTSTENSDRDSDLEVVADFVPVNLRCPWQCPICLKNYSLEHIIIDPYVNRITSQLQTYGEEVSEIEVKPDGSWRAKAEGNQRSIGDLGGWHLPDGTLIESQDIESKPKLGILKRVIQEGSSESCGLKVGLKKKRNDRNPPAPARGAEVIVISDSDEENEPFISCASTYNNNHTDAPIVTFAGTWDEYVAFAYC